MVVVVVEDVLRFCWLLEETGPCGPRGDVVVLADADVLLSVCKERDRPFIPCGGDGAGANSTFSNELVR